MPYTPDLRKRLSLQLNTLIPPLSAVMCIPIVATGWGHWGRFAALVALYAYSGVSNAVLVKMTNHIVEDRRGPNSLFFVNNLAVMLAAGVMTHWSAPACVWLVIWTLCFCITNDENVKGYVFTSVGLTTALALVQGADPMLMIPLALTSIGLFVLLSQRARILHAALDELADAMKARLQAEVELRQAQKLQAVGRLAAGVAHEINTPVQYVRDSMQFLAEGIGNLSSLAKTYREELPEASREKMREVEERADLEYLLENMPDAVGRSTTGLDRIATIVKSMRDFAHPDQVEMKPADLNRSIESTLTIANSEFKLVADLEKKLEPLPPVTCHAGELNQVVLNLVVNASHAIADRVGKSGARGLITVATRLDGEHVVISVRDTGSGIPEHVRGNLFEPFFTTKPVGVGTGQGLTIVKSIVERHGGRVWFDTKEGFGTTFFASVRLMPPQLAKVLPLKAA